MSATPEELARDFPLPDAMSYVHHGVWASKKTDVRAPSPATITRRIPLVRPTCNDSASSLDDAKSLADDKPRTSDRTRGYHLASGISNPDLQALDDLSQLRKNNLMRKPCWPYGYTKQKTFSMLNAPVQGVACPPDMRRDAWRESDYTVHLKIYQGSHSKVYKATCNVTGQPVIIKVYIKARLHGLHCAQIHREIQIHSNLLHDNIIDFYGAFEDDSFYFLILETAQEGDLFDFMARSMSYDTEQKLVTEMVRPLIRAVNYLHDKGIIHRDIKPENILLTKGLKVKLADFGLAIDQQMEMPVSRTGTVEYMAPEALRNPLKRRPDEFKTETELGYDEKVDSWSLAMVIYEIVFGSPAVGKNSTGREDLLRAMQKQLNRAGGSLSKEGRDFLRQNLTNEPQSRLTACDMLKHAWVLRTDFAQPEGKSRAGKDLGHDKPEEGRHPGAAENESSKQDNPCPDSSAAPVEDPQPQKGLVLPGCARLQRLRVEHRLSGAAAGLTSSKWWRRQTCGPESQGSPFHPSQDDPSSKIKKLLTALKASSERLSIA